MKLTDLSERFIAETNAILGGEADAEKRIEQYRDIDFIAKSLHYQIKRIGFHLRKEMAKEGHCENC